MKFLKNKKLGYWFMVATAVLSLVLFIIYLVTFEPGMYGHGHTMPNSAAGKGAELVWIWALFALLIQLAALAAPEHKWLEFFVVGAIGGAFFVEMQLCPTVLAAVATGVAYEGGSLPLHLTYLILILVSWAVSIASCFMETIGQEEEESLKKTLALPRFAGATGVAGVLVILGIVLTSVIPNAQGGVVVDSTEATKPFVIDLQKEFGDKVDASYTFDPTSVHFTKESNPYSAYTNENERKNAIQTAVGSADTREGVNIVYRFEGAYAEGWQGDYSKHYAYINVFSDGLYNGSSNGTNIYGYWYDTEDGGEAGSTLVFVDNRGRDNDMVCSVATSKFYKWVTDVKSTLNQGRTIKAFGYYYYPTIGFYVDPGVDYVVVKSAEGLDKNTVTLGWSGIRVLNNFNVGAVFDADKNLKFGEIEDTEDPNIKKITATWTTYTWDTLIYIGEAPAAPEAPASAAE